jgi:GxxExxY protein
VDVFYKGQNLGVFRMDLVIDGKVILELKAVKELNDLFRQQVLAYLKATGLRLGILINFGAEKVQTTRVVL